jgi:hypothetical protein
VSALEAWLEKREPVPPQNLAVALLSAAASARGAPDGESSSHALARVGRTRLDSALARPGRERESAFRLLEADGLLTYACEAALEEDGPVAALHGILAVAGR